MRENIYSEIFMWNREIDELQRVLQRLETAGIWGKQERKVYKVRLEEIRAGLNADFAEAVAVRERDDETRLRTQRTAWEMQNTDHEEKQRKEIRQSQPDVLAKDSEHSLNNFAIECFNCKK